MSNGAILVPLLVPAAILFLIGYSFYRHRRRLRFIAQYQWPAGLTAKLQRAHPQLRTADVADVGAGLKQFFRAYLRSGRRPVTMPSQIVDELWHEFILCTRDYQRFCARAFGRFLHHTPAATLAKGQKAGNEGLRRVWWQVCKEEGIDPRNAGRLPLLFSLDERLAIPGGYRYAPDCRRLRHGSGEAGIGVTYCASDFTSPSFDGGTAGLGAGDGGGDGEGGGGCGGD